MLFLLAACDPKDEVGPKKSKDVPVVLDTQGVNSGPENNPGVIIVGDSPGEKCKKGTAKKGCIYFAPDEDGAITFSVKGQAPNRSCTAPSAKNGAVITKIELTDTDLTPGPVPTEKGDFSIDRSQHPLAAKYKDDGFPALVLNTGIVFEENNVSKVGMTTVKITNLNKSNVDNPQGVNIWYKVTLATCKTPRGFWVTDPRIENGGMN